MTKKETKVLVYNPPKKEMQTIMFEMPLADFKQLLSLLDKDADLAEELRKAIKAHIEKLQNARNLNFIKEELESIFSRAKQSMTPQPKKPRKKGKTK
jgi:hypothetical protein